jgi:hypothetical protein
MTTAEPRFIPVSGQTIPVSRSKALMTVFIGLGAVLLGAGMIYFNWTKLGGAAIFGGILMSVLLGFPALFSSQRLVLGNACFQVLKGKGEVVTHVPFSNIAELRYVEHVPPFVGINLLNVADPESFSRSGFQSLKSHHGYDDVLVDIYAEEPKAIYEKLRYRYEVFIARGGSPS